MKKGLLLALVFAMLLSAVAGCIVGGTAETESVFEQEDRLRKEAISAALGTAEGSSSRVFLQEDKPAEGRYIVKFAKTVSEKALLTYLDGTDYTLLSDSEERVFVLYTEDVQALESKAGDDLLYCCEDRVLTTASVTSDPMADSLAEYEQMELYSAWDIGTARSDIIVAVLDTGLDRTHEDLAGANILNGYDATTRASAVNTDSNGHGTAVTGLIAAVANNDLGTAGVAHGVTILPIRVAGDAHLIYSSDLIGGIRFAADAGARILNLSFGGYTYSAAEYDAVNYALNKGCILIAAAGNDGATLQGTQEVYPASYEGVISVGSCDEDGERSDFSQNNAQVDLLAPGEDLLLIGMDENGGSIYYRDDGTSYSCALVSGIAALALSVLEPAAVRFEGEELLSLLADGRTGKNGSGYGAVSALTAMENANRPLVVGVENNRTYNSQVTVRFNRGTALLDGEEFYDGETVYQNGRHVLIVSDGDRREILAFRINYTPASYEKSETAEGVVFTFGTGTASLDGFPYTSGTVITEPGWHRFVLTDAVGDTLEEQFYCDLSLPQVSGIEDGGVYTQPVLLRIAGDGKATLDGTEIGRECFVAEDGVHELTVSKNGNKQTYTFTLQTEVRQYENALARSGVIADSQNGWYAVYSELLTGMRVYDAESGELLQVLNTETVNGYAYAGEYLLIFGEWKLSVLDPAQMKNGDPFVMQYALRCEGFAYLNETLYCLTDGGLHTMLFEDGSLLRLLDSDADEIYTDGTYIWLYHSEENRFDRYDGADVLSFTPQVNMKSKRKLFADGWLFCGESAIRLSDFSVRFAYEGYAVSCSDTLLYATDGVYRLSDGVLVGTYGQTVSGVLRTDGGTYVCGYAGGILFYPLSDGYADTTGSLLTDARESNPYTALQEIRGQAVPTALASYGNRTAAVFAEQRRFLLWIDGAKAEETSLPFSPTGVCLHDAHVCIWDGKHGILWLDGVQYSVGMPVSDAFFAMGTLYLLCDGRLYRFENGSVTDTGIEAVSATGGETLLAYVRHGYLYVYDGVSTRMTRVTSDELCTDGRYIRAGNRIYDALTLTQLYRTEEDVLAMCDGAMLTATGLYDTASGTVLSAFDASGCELACMGGTAGIVLYSRFAFTCTRYAYAVWEEPFYDGMSDGALVNGQTAIIYDRGLAYLDGVPYEQGAAVAASGTHTFTLVLPCAVVRTYTFTVVPKLGGIALSTSVYRLAVGESGVLHVQYYPSGTSAIPVVYSLEGDCIRLEPDGSFTALFEGEAYVHVETADGQYHASCRIVVDSAILRFDTESGYTVDRGAGILLDVPSGTRASEVIDAVISEGVVTASTRVVGTGTVLTLATESGEVLDSLIAAIEGDLDGDGYVTLADLLVLEDMLQNGKTLDGALAYAADLNGSGTVTDRDANLLLELILFENDAPRRAIPATGETGTVGVFLPSTVYNGDTVGITLYLQNSNTADVQGICGASGRLRFDASVLSFVRADTYGWNVEYYDDGGWVSFAAKGTAATAEQPIVTLWFAVRSTAEDSELLLRDGVVLCDSGAYGLERVSVLLTAGERTYGDVSLSVSGMTEPFSAEQTSYEVILPAGTPALDYALQYPDGYTVEVKNTVFDRTDTLTATFTFRASDGSSTVYTVYAKRGDTVPTVFDTTLHSLTAKEIGFAFDPSVTVYTLSVPAEVEALTLQWSAAEDVTVICSETSLKAGGQTVITLTVTAPDGTQTVYTLDVYREKAAESPSQANGTEDGGQSALWLIPVLILLVGGTGIVWMNRRGKARKTAGE